jgi:hypothetical protein
VLATGFQPARGCLEKSSAAHCRMARTHYPRRRRNILGMASVVMAVLFIVAAIRHNFNAARETRFFNLGAEAYFSRPFPDLSNWLARSSSKPIAKNLPVIIDRTFGNIVAVDFGKKFDVSNISADAATTEMLENDTVEVVMIDGLPMTDSQLAQLTALKRLRELGLRNTKVTPAGIARFQQARPDVTLQQLPGTPEPTGGR